MQILRERQLVQYWQQVGHWPEHVQRTTATMDLTTAPGGRPTRLFHQSPSHLHDTSSYRITASSCDFFIFCPALIRHMFSDSVEMKTVFNDLSCRIWLMAAKHCSMQCLCSRLSVVMTAGRRCCVAINNHRWTQHPPPQPAAVSENWLVTGPSTTVNQWRVHTCPVEYESFLLCDWPTTDTNGVLTCVAWP